MAEETVDAEQAAAKGVWQSVFVSAVIGWFVLLAITFAAVEHGPEPLVEQRGLHTGGSLVDAEQ